MTDNILGIVLGALMCAIFFLFLRLFVLVKDVMTAITLELRFIQYLWNNFIQFFKRNDE